MTAEAVVLAALTEVLDLDAGFADVALAGRHGALTEDVLDLDAGLAGVIGPAVVPSENRGSAALVRRATPSEHQFTFTAVGQLASLLDGTAPGDRLVLRQSSAPVAVIDALDLVLRLQDLRRLVVRGAPALADLARCLIRATTLTIDLLDTAERIRGSVPPQWVTRLDYGTHLLRGLRLDLDVDPEDRHAVFARLHYVLDAKRDQELFRALGDVFAVWLDIPGTLPLNLVASDGVRRNRHGSLADCLDRDVTEFRRRCDDFTGADLRNEDLSRFDLEGIRWSRATTVWPEQWRALIEDESVEIEPGILEVRHGRSHVGVR